LQAPQPRLDHDFNMPFLGEKWGSLSLQVERDPKTTP
jgi:hypothetical protein